MNAKFYRKDVSQEQEAADSLDGQSHPHHTHLAMALWRSCVPWLLLAVHVARGDVYHKASRSTAMTGFRNEAESDPEYWYSEAYAGIAERERRGAGAGAAASAARNVVMFLGDGMSVPTLAAARTLLGQRRNRTGEEAQLAFEAFPTVGMVKTYCVDAQIADSACTATAYLCGVKANYGTLGVTAGVPRGACAATEDTAHRLDSIAAWALADGRDAGEYWPDDVWHGSAESNAELVASIDHIEVSIVTTTRVTHASPAGAYARSADREWESDADVPAACAQHDIARQLLTAPPGDKFKVILGGGRREFLPNTTVDHEGAAGRRLDGRDLVAEWTDRRRAAGDSYLYATGRDALLAALTTRPDYVLGLFESSHMQYHLEADPRTQPTLAELTEVAIDTLKRNERGFFLFVEGGRIDHAHHENMAHLALDETIELSAAVQRATKLLAEEDSLVVVTSDHSHAMAFNGYTRRGGDILGPSDDLGDDGVPYMTLSYSNGPAYRPPAASGLRDDPTQYDYGVTRAQHPAAVPLDSETHGGDDVSVFAWGAAHGMFSGLYEQSQLPHLMAYAACLGPGPQAPACRVDSAA